MNEATVSHYHTDVAAECEGVDPVEGDEPGAGQGGEGGGEHGAGLDQDGQPRPHHHRQVARQPAGSHRYQW